MATLVRLRGLDRGDSAVGAGNMARGFRVKSGLGSRYDSGVKAFRDIGAGNAGVKVSAKYGGTYGNSISVATIDPAGNNEALSVAVTYGSDGFPDIVVTLATDGSSAVTSTAAQVRAAINAHFEASQWVTATLLGDGTGTAVAAAAANLASGTNVGTAAPMYLNVSHRTTAVVDVDDRDTAKALRRNAGRFVTLGEVA